MAETDRSAQDISLREISSRDEKYMREALKQAKKAMLIGEVPIGCVVVERESGRIVGRGYNRRNTDRSTLSHAEMTAIKKASKVMGDWRLEGCDIYITLEPCPMCAGAIVQARLDRCIFAADSDKSGCGGSIMDILHQPLFNHQVETVKGVCKEEAKQLLQTFFRELRIRNKECM